MKTIKLQEIREIYHDEDTISFLDKRGDIIFDIMKTTEGDVLSVPDEFDGTINIIFLKDKVINCNENEIDPAIETLSPWEVMEIMQSDDELKKIDKDIATYIATGGTPLPCASCIYSDDLFHECKCEPEK